MQAAVAVVGDLIQNILFLFAGRSIQRYLLHDLLFGFLVLARDAMEQREISPNSVCYSIFLVHAEKAEEQRERDDFSNRAPSIIEL